MCANQRFITGCRNKVLFCSVVGKIEISEDLFVNSEYRYRVSAGESGPLSS